MANSVFCGKIFFLKSFFLKRCSKRSKLMKTKRKSCYTFATLLHFNADRARFLVFKKLFPRKNTIGDLQWQRSDVHLDWQFFYICLRVWLLIRKIISIYNDLLWCLIWMIFFNAISRSSIGLKLKTFFT